MRWNVDFIKFNPRLSQWEYKENNQIKITLSLRKILPSYQKQQKLSLEVYSYICFLIKLETLGILEPLQSFEI